jgi:DNA-binding IscR family transcriptional regulator
MLSYFFKFVKKIKNMFSKTCEYGIRATIFIASESYQDKRVGLKDLAKFYQETTLFIP